MAAPERFSAFSAPMFSASPAKCRKEDISVATPPENALIMPSAGSTSALSVRAAAAERGMGGSLSKAACVFSSFFSQNSAI